MNTKIKPGNEAPIAAEKAKEELKKTKNPVDIIDPPLKLPKIRKPSSLQQDKQTNEKSANIQTKSDAQPINNLVKKTTQLDLTQRQNEQPNKAAAEHPMEPEKKTQQPIQKRQEDRVSTVSSLSYKFSLPPPPKGNAIFFSDLNVRELTPGIHSVTVSNGNPEKKIFCVVENFEELPKYVRSITKAVKKCASKESPPGFDPKCEEMILAKFEGDFYRACVTDKNEKGYVVLFVDFGNTDTVQASDIKPFDKSLMMDIVTNDVELQNIPAPLTKKAKAMLMNENGLQINVKKERSATGVYIADIVGL